MNMSTFEEVLNNIEEVSKLLTEWEEEDNAGRDVTPVLTRLAEIFEVETKVFLKQGPDPFDDRHPSRSQPDCTLGHILKSVFRHRRIVDEMVKVYCQRDIFELNTAVCRFLLLILPGLESVIFQEESFVLKLFEWAERAPNPLQSYATGLLAAAMEVPEIVPNYREKNAYFVPLMLKRLYELSQIYFQNTKSDNDPQYAPSLSMHSENEYEPMSPVSEEKSNIKRNSKKRKGNAKVRFNPIYSESKMKEKKQTLQIPPVDESIINDSSNSTWTENMLGSYQVFPLTLVTQQKHILQYLTPMGEYQELIGPVFEESALTLTLRYIDLNQNHDVGLAFDALKYLASLLNHKKIAIEFINIGGLQLLLKVPRASIAATGVSFCLYYLGYPEELLERICMFPPEVISELVSYALWLLECSHDSSRCHATLFFGFAFSFKKLLHHFDQQDGLRKLLNVMSTLDIFVLRNPRTLNDDDIYGDRLTTRHVCGSLKRYFEAHLALLVEEKRRNTSRGNDDSSNIDGKSSLAISTTCESVEKNMELLQDLLNAPLLRWKPVDEFVKLDGVTFLFDLILSFLKVSFSVRVDILKNALDVLKICALSASAKAKFCEKIPSRESQHVTGISVLLQVAEIQFPVADIQRSALHTIINCVCPKIHTVEVSHRTISLKRRCRVFEDLLNKVWKAVRIKNGIIVLINLLSTKTPHIDADSIRALACKALCGLARSQNVKQIISKLPLFTDGQLINLMREPALPDRYHDHVHFCKYALELIERVTGAPMALLKLDFNKICGSEVVAKTKVVYNEHQLLQLIRDHLTVKGFHQTVQCLQQEMEEKSTATKSPIFFRSAFSSPTERASPNRPLKTSLFAEKSKGFTNVSFSASSPASSLSIPFVPPPSVPLKIILNKKTASPDIKSPPPYRLQKPQMCSGNYTLSPSFSKMKRQVPGTSYGPFQSSISLDTIVTEYLRKQHSLCRNPVSACPPFDLFVPHKCPEPQFKRNAPTNCVLRLQKREISFENGGYQGAALNNKHIYSRFRLHRTCRDEDGRCEFSTCAFYTNSEVVPKLFVGTGEGVIKVFNINSGKQILSKDCHFRGISHIESSESSSLFITSDGGRVGKSSLWNFNSSSALNVVHNFSEVCHMEFGKRNVERLVGSKHFSTSIYDANTFAEIQSFPLIGVGNNYINNRATFDFTDELVLSDGLIYDVRSGKILHKLDKFYSSINGVFHPNGREIILNSEIWDIRTFKLLRTVAQLDQCKVTFNKAGSMMYAVTLKDPLRHSTMNCFYTLDAHNYNTIATVDVKKPVFHIATDLNDEFISTLEHVNGLEFICRLYAVGRTKQAGDEDDDESEDSSDDDDDNDNNDETDEGDLDFGENGGEVNDVLLDVAVEDDDDDDDDDDLNWPTTNSSSSSDDEDTLFSLNTSFDD